MVPDLSVPLRSIASHRSNVPTRSDYVIVNYDKNPRASRSRRWFAICRNVCTCVLLSILFLYFVTFVRLGSSRSSQWSKSTAPPPKEILRYAGEHISWEWCDDLDPNARWLECSTIDVPMDQFDAGNSGDKTFRIPLIRMRGKNATQNLILNPGGPGASGSEFLYRRGELLRTIVGEGFHLLTFDPRGVNRSRPLATCYPDDETRRERSPVRATRPVEDSIEAFTWTHNYVKACADTMGEHGKYINSPQTAADMNSILDAVGQDAMFYWGFSYGTILGQTYATLFPNRSERVIIDGVANQFDWYISLLETEEFADSENVLDGFLDECVRAGKDCPLTAIAPTKEGIRWRLFTAADSLDNDPLDIYINNTLYGVFTAENLVYDAIFPTLYKPADWYILADRLTKLLQGNGTEAFLAYSLHKPWEFAGDATQFVMFNDGTSGPDNWPQNRLSFLDLISPWINSSIFAPTENGGLYMKQQWRLPRTHAYVPRRGVETARPLLILSTTYDPICPLVSAQSAQERFEGSRIVEVQGYGHCSIAVPSLCAARHVRAFLYNGTLPVENTECEVDGPYFVNPKSGGVGPLKNFDDVEDRGIHLAQVRLAREWEWKHR